jgi:hypothetical protein
MPESTPELPAPEGCAASAGSVLPATPESNRWQFHRDNGHAREHVIVVPAVFAQRLERERDELRERMTNLHSVVTGEWESKDAFVARVRAILFPPQNVEPSYGDGGKK